MADQGDKETARWEALLEADAFGELSEAERREMEELAEKIPEFRSELFALRGLAADFSEREQLVPADHELIDTVLQRHGRNQWRSKRKKVLRIAAVAAIPTVAAAAMVYGDGLSTSDGDAPGENSAPVESADSEPNTPAGEGIRSEEPGPSEIGEADATKARDEVVESDPAEKTGSTMPTAGALLTRAQEQRSSGQYARAMSTYRRLLSSYPSSSEAKLSHVSLAQLLLAQGNASGALEEFREYEAMGGGAQSQEAHFGVIQSLRALGRVEEERRETERFLKRYPKSIQSASLKRRLGEASD